MFTLTGVAGGPLCLRLLNQNAVNHTFAPGAVVLGNVTFTVVVLMLPSNFQADSVVGDSSPMKLKMAAPLTPAGQGCSPAVAPPRPLRGPEGVFGKKTDRRENAVRNP